MKSILEIFPRASQSTIAANPQIGEAKSPQNSLQTPQNSKKRGSMNKTESEYALILEAMKRQGDILRYEYEGITLRWADMKYTPDFVIFEEPTFGGDPPGIKLIEVKGGHIWDRDIVRFKGARAYWPEFRFEMWQKKKGQWTQIL